MKQKICAVGNTHFDPVWLWTLDEAMVSIRSTFRSALDRMKEYPEFIYSFSCPPVFEWIRETDPELFEERGIDLPNPLRARAESYLSEGSTVIYLAADRQAAGFLVLSDTLRPDADQMIDQVEQTGITPVLLTGDHENAAVHIAGLLHIREVHAGCLPEDKLSRIDTYQQNGQPVCMIGDGINDAPALKKAYVGIAMGKIGSDIAVDAADIALVDDDIKELPHLLRLAKRMMTTIRLNLTFSMTLNFAAIILAITGILNPVVGALVHNTGSVLVIVNSAFLLRWRKKAAKKAGHS